jgi:hypothetical protein
VDWTAHARRVIARLGEDATYTPQGGGQSSTVRGIYLQPFTPSLGMEASEPTFACISTDAPALAHGATLLIRGTTFTVIELEPDPLLGTTVAILRK